MRAMFHRCCDSTTACFWSSGIAAMYISSKCVDSGLGGSSEGPPHATSTLKQTIDNSPRIVGTSLLRSGHKSYAVLEMTTLLAVDVGNTNTVIGVFVEGELSAHWRIQTIAERTSDEYAVLVKTLLDMQGISWQTIDAGIISSVVPPAVFGLQRFFKSHCGGSALVVGPGIKTGMP